MHIYDRFSSDPGAERLRYEEKMVRARVNIQQRYEIAGCSAQAFVHLIRHSTCPVIAVPGVYRRHQERLDALFQAGSMDMNRLVPMQEDPRPGSQYPTPFNKNG